MLYMSSFLKPWYICVEKIEANQHLTNSAKEKFNYFIDKYHIYHIFNEYYSKITMTVMHKLQRYKKSEKFKNLN